MIDDFSCNILNLHFFFDETSNAMVQLIRSKSERKWEEWLLVLLLLSIFFFLLEPARPFYREFKLSDLSLQHPFANKERITDNELYAISTIIPLVIIAIYRRGSTNMHDSILGLFVSLSVAGVLTDFLKIWIGRPRPDFLERCGPIEGTSRYDFVDVTVCSAPLGIAYLNDGMKSTPSGHASLSFSGLFYLYLWLYQELKLSRHVSTYIHIACFLPLLLAIYVSLSRTQDYRHHFIDIVLGSIIGISIASLAFKSYCIPQSLKSVLPT